MRKYLDASSIVSVYFSQIGTSVLFIIYAPPLLCVVFLQADRRLWKAPLVSQLFPFLWAEPHHADVSLFCEDRSWQNDFSNSRSRITAWVARFLFEKVVAYSPRGSLSHKRICLLYSVVKELWRKRVAFM